MADTPTPEIALIAAVARNRAIGLGPELVFHEPSDQKHFRDTTMGSPVIMGRKTWDSLPPRFRPLPGRLNVVLTRQPDWAAPGALAVHGLAEALARVQGAPRVFVMGGAELYAQALPLAHTLVLTEVDADLPGDAFFPAWDRGRFDETLRTPGRTAAGVDYAFVTYRRRPAG